MDGCGPHGRRTPGLRWRAVSVAVSCDANWRTARANARSPCAFPFHPRLQSAARRVHFAAPGCARVGAAGAGTASTVGVGERRAPAMHTARGEVNRLCATLDAPTDLRYSSRQPENEFRPSATTGPSSVQAAGEAVSGGHARQGTAQLPAGRPATSK